MMLARFMLAPPIVTGLAHRALHFGWQRFGRDLQAAGACRRCIITTAIALETSKGNLGLVLTLGGVLIAIIVGISAGVLALTGRRDRWFDWCW